MRRGLVRAAMVGGYLCSAAIGVWLLFPSVASFLLEEWLHRDGFQDVSVHIGFPGWGSIVVSEIRLKQILNGERLSIESKGIVMGYSLTNLLTGRLDQVLLPDVSISLVYDARSDLDDVARDEGTLPGQSFSPLNMLTVSDLVQGLPVLPCEELRLGRLVIVREQATGPLREVHVAGTVRQQAEGLLAELTFQGKDTQAFVLRVSDLETHVMSIQLESRSASLTPIFNWRSEAVSDEVQVQLRGMFDVNVQELAPFIALILPIGSEWQQVTGRVQANWAGSAPSKVALPSVWRDPATQVQGTAQLGLKLPELKGIGKDLVVSVSGKFSGNATQLRWSINPGPIVTAAIETKKIGVLQSLRAFLPVGSQSFRVESKKEVTGELRWAKTPPRFTAMGPVTLSYDSINAPTHIELILAHLAGHGKVIETAEGVFEVVGSLPDIVNERLSLKQARANIGGNLSLNGGDIRGSILPSSSLTATRFQQAMASVARGTMQFSDTLPVRFNMTTGEWEVGPSTITLRFPEIRLAKHQVMVQQAAFRLEELRGSASSWKSQGTVMIHGLRVDQPMGRSMPAYLTVRLAADPAVIKADIQAGTQDKLMTLNAQVEHTLATGRGRVQGTLGPVTFDRTGLRLRQLWSPWPFPVDMTGGRLSATFDLDWESGAPAGAAVRSGRGEIVMENLSGQYRDLVFTGLDTNVHVTAISTDTIATSRPAEIKIASVNQGIEVTRVSLRTQVDWNRRKSLPLVEVRDIRCELLGGNVTSQGVRADLANPPYSFTVLARALDLAKILSLEQQKGLQGSGLLDGTIPITVTSHGITVKDGVIEARPPGGVIQYQASAEAAKAVTGTNANMQLVLQALNNFHYNVLQVGTQYSEDGTLNLNARLEGRNPDLKKTPPLHFNLTVQENIPALLKSLRLVQDIEESVQNRFVRP